MWIHYADPNPHEYAQIRTLQDEWQAAKDDQCYKYVSHDWVLKLMLKISG